MGLTGSTHSLPREKNPANRVCHRGITLGLARVNTGLVTFHACPHVGTWPLDTRSAACMCLPTVVQGRPTHRGLRLGPGRRGRVMASALGTGLAVLGVRSATFRQSSNPGRAEGLLSASSEPAGGECVVICTRGCGGHGLGSQLKKIQLMVAFAGSRKMLEKILKVLKRTTFLGRAKGVR